MTIGDLIGMLTDMISGFFKQIYEYLNIPGWFEKISEVTDGAKKDMVQHINKEQWMMLAVIILAILALVFIKNFSNCFLEYSIKMILVACFVVIVVALVGCILKGNLDFAVLVLLLALILYLMKKVFSKPKGKS